MPRLSRRASAYTPVSRQKAPVGLGRAVAYASVAALQVGRASREAGVLAGWAAEFGEALNLTLPKQSNDDWPAISRRRLPDAATWRAVLAALRGAADQQRGGTKQIRKLARALGLDATEAAILQLAIDYACCAPCERLWDMFAEARNTPPFFWADAGLIALLTGRDLARIQRRLLPGGALFTSGVLRLADNRGLQVLDRVRRMALEGGRAEATTALLGPRRAASLPVEAFRHLGPDLDRTLDLLRGAIGQGAPGIHVLLYGPPGTGKTELACTLAGALGVPLHAVGETDENGGEPSRHERLSEFQLAQRLLVRAEPALLLFDEAEDIFAPADPFAPRASVRSRAFVHRLLEQGRAPVIWTANDLGAFPQPVLRRMACCLEIRVPPEPVRRRLWAVAAKEEGVTLPEPEAARLARNLPVAPALARSALRAARLAGGAGETVRWALTGVARAMARGELPEARPDHAFDLRLVTADRDLAALADRLAAPEVSRRVSLLLSGPPGSGKSAFARYLAERMGMPVLQRRASDLFGAFVGENEQRIAAAFAEARADGAFLIFDEADSLLADRRDAVRSWEVSQVNEMLTWMESHALPFCCTTNLPERLDPATTRRFLVKARFGWLSAAQSSLAFAEAFSVASPPGLAALGCLTPADFGLVRRRMELGDVAREPAALLAALECEQAAKPGISAPLGFRIPA